MLTVDELVQYVDQHCPSPAAIAPNKQPLWERLKTDPNAALRGLLARRLTRLGRWKEARAYFPPDVQSVLDQYITAIRFGHDRNRPADERAASLWSAAHIAHDKGMDLLGTEMVPDFYWLDGYFDFHFSPQSRCKDPDALTAPTPDEQRRAADAAPKPNARFHYRYLAADHAWAAAQLLPDENDQTAKILCIAGSWLKRRDPKAAQRFYKSLVSRCGTTELGRRADRLRWLPDIPDE